MRVNLPWFVIPYHLTTLERLVALSAPMKRRRLPWHHQPAPEEK